MNSRRKFIKQTSLIGAGLSILPSMPFASPVRISGKKLRVGFIGVGLRGTNHVNNVLLRKDVEVAAICDIDSKRIDLCLDLLKKASHSVPKIR